MIRRHPGCTTRCLLCAGTSAQQGLSYSSHRGFIAGFGQHFVKTGELPREAHRWLGEAFDRRQQGDYEAVPVVQEHHVLELQANAAEFLRRSLPTARGK
jgi:uncharacterized protein (UPF0332 family)